MKKKSMSRTAFFRLRVLVGVVTLLTATFLALFAVANQRRVTSDQLNQLDAQMRAPNSGPLWGYVGSVREAWVTSYTGIFDDEPTGIAVDGSLNVYVTGYSSIPDYSAYVTIKYNPFGQEEWTASYADPNSINGAAAIAVDKSGNVYVTGTSGSFPSGGFDYATIKYNSAGQQQWVARYNGPGNGSDGATAIGVDGSGNVYVTGNSVGSDGHADYATIKYNNAGQQQWVARYSGQDNGEDYALAIAVDSSGNAYVTGSSFISNAGYDYATIKYDSSGQEQWVARYDGPGNAEDNAVAIVVDQSGNVYITGSSTGSGTGADYATIKYDSAGQQQWVAHYNGPGNLGDSATGIGIDGSGNVYVTGTSVGSDGVPNYATIKYNSVGQQQWVARYTGPDNLGDIATAIAVSSSGSVYVTGQSGALDTGSDYATIKYDSSGQEQWVTRYNGPDNLDDYPTDIAVDRLGNAYVTGATRKDPIQYNWDFATIKYIPDRTPLPHPRPSP
jgi:hypothetical protein